MDIVLAIIGVIAATVGTVAGVLQVLEYLQKRREKSAHSPHPRSQSTHSPPPCSSEHLTQLRHILVERFDEGELRTLCFDLGVDYDSLPGKGKADKARELVAHLERRARTSELIETGKRRRPDIVEWSQARLDVDMQGLVARRDQADRERRAMRERQRVVNLRPLDVTHTFKDRQREMQALCVQLADEGARLVSIVGRGGMGKTALACRVLADLEGGVLTVPGEERELAIDGILYLSARSTGLGLERVYADVGRMLGEPIAGKLAARWASRDLPLAAKIEYLLEVLGDGLYLILLDNLEDVLTEEGVIAGEGLRLFVERCLTMPGGARLVVTSREEVKVAAGGLRGVRSLPLREGLPEEEAVALLRDLDPSGRLGLRDGAEHDLRRAARLTRGIPRALEVLAGILQEDPAASLARFLDDEGLFGEQVVERLIAGGYGRLGEGERRVMEALAVFDRPVEETAVAYLLHPWFPGLDVRGGLRRLVSGYFVSASRVTGEYSLHPLDHDYAYRHLPDGGEVDAYTRRNLELRASDFYASIRKPESEWQSIDDLTPQLAEFEHRVRAGDYDGACQAIYLIDIDYLYLWGHFAQIVELRERLVERLTDPALESYNLGSLGRARNALGQFERAIKCLKQALVIACKIGEQRMESIWRGNLGNTYGALRQVEQALKSYSKAVEISQAIGNRRGEGIWLGGQAKAYRTLGQIERAVELFEESLPIIRESRDRRVEVSLLAGLGLAYLSLGRTEESIQFHERSLSVAREVSARRGEEISLGNLGRAHHHLGQFEQAIRFYKQSLVIADELNDRRGQSYCMLGLGRALLATEEFLQAQLYCEEALTWSMPETNCQAALVLGIALLYQDDSSTRDAFVDAATYCQSLLDKSKSLYEPRYTLAAALTGNAVCDPHWTDKNKRPDLLTPALTEYRQALETCPAPGVVAEALRDLELIQAAGIEGLEPVFELLKMTAD